MKREKQLKIYCILFIPGFISIPGSFCISDKDIMFLLVVLWIDIIAVNHNKDAASAQNIAPSANMSSYIYREHERR